MPSRDGPAHRAFVHRVEPEKHPKHAPPAPPAARDAGIERAPNVRAQGATKNSQTAQTKPTVQTSERSVAQFSR